MANKDFTAGARPFDMGSGSRARMMPYKVAASTTIYANAPLITVADGTVAMTASVNNVVNWIGFAVHPIVSSSAIQTVMVYDDPFQKFIIQSDAALAATDVHLNADFINPNTEFSSTRYSNCELDGSTAVATFDNSEPLHILGKVERSDNTWLIHVDVIVQWNLGVHANGPVGVGI